jgi:phospholipid transport system transporter-binding protein
MYRAAQTLTVANAQTILEDGLRAIANGQMHFDLAELSAVDSAAVATLLAWQRAARSGGKSVVFTNIPTNLQSLCELYGVSALIPTSASAASGTESRTDLLHH